MRDVATRIRLISDSIDAILLVPVSPGRRLGLAVPVAMSVVCCVVLLSCIVLVLGA